MSMLSIVRSRLCIVCRVPSLTSPLRLAAQMEPSTRRTAELCMRNLSSNLRMAKAHGVPMLPISPLHLLA